MSRSRTRERGWPPDPEPLGSSVVDNHTHLESLLDFPVDDPDGPRTLDDHLERAATGGVTRIVQVGCDLDAAAWTDRLLRSSAAGDQAGPRVGLLGAVAIHPNEAVLHAGVREVAPDGLEPSSAERHEVGLDDAIAAIAEIARGNDRVRAIGETGLDHFRAGPQGRAVQVEAFRAHIALAKELGLALQIHDRDAHGQVIEVLERDGAPDRTVFHCFSGDAALARYCAARGWYLSFAGPVTFGANDDLREALRAVPLSQVLVETDAPYLTPHPYRGRPNAPYLLPHTVRRIAAELDLDVDHLCRTLTATSESVYGKWQTGRTG
ncbi:MAG TPA: TatD family hydrolase [Cellulomonas sp.]|uniref:TatD family hydrolase n=1 Tax=Cellulomonas sp. TaxID=40001 RepID=UPI002E328623|nr:TatD family hydrolase [Cellulomonas sp.]HEX5333009.1 TatD family hydrolase [Cellulomonas sp.]